MRCLPGKKKKDNAAMDGDKVSFVEFKKLALKVAVIREVNDHPNADKLYVLTIDTGDGSKQIVAGIKSSYQKEELLGKQVVIIDNLEPAMLRGVESQAMLLAASDENGIVIIKPEREMKTGSIVK
jgi:methionine--tRNA ligase beta chain